MSPKSVGLGNMDAGYAKASKSLKVFRLENIKAKIDKGKLIFIESDDGKE